MRILVTNDDGIRSPYLAMLAEAAKKLGEVTVIAPMEQRPTARLLHAEGIPRRRFAVDVTQHSGVPWIDGHHNARVPTVPPGTYAIWNMMVNTNTLPRAANLFQ